MVIGKELSAAICPISAAMSKPRIDRFFEDEPFLHLSSYGGAGLGSVAASAMLDILTGPGFLENVKERADQFARGLADMCTRYPWLIKQVRQRGLMIGMEMREDMYDPALTLALAQRGVLANYAGARENTVIIMPPLIIGPEDTELALNALEDSLRIMATSE